MLNVRGRMLGAVVDAAPDVLALGADSIKAPPEMATSVDADYIIGIGCIKNGDVARMLILTDIEALMGGADLGLTDAA